MRKTQCQRCQIEKDGCGELCVSCERAVTVRCPQCCYYDGRVYRLRPLRRGQKRPYCACCDDARYLRLWVNGEAVSAPRR
jgi:hypothetical protein